MQEDMLAYVNKIRKAHGKSELKIGTEPMLEAAKKHSINQANSNSMGHFGFDKRARGSGAASENVAWGQRSIKEVVRTWRESSGHLANILSARKNVVLGVAKNAKGDPYWTMLLS